MRMSKPHPPKLETFDVATRINTDPKGVQRAVERFRVTPFGLYMARPTPGRRQFHYLESWLLPELGLRITDFWFNPGHTRDQDFYLDVVDVQSDGSVWRVTDLYLDLVLRDKRGIEVLDAEELIAAVQAKLLSEAAAHRALQTSFGTIAALAEHGYDLRGWLSARGIEPTWQRR